MSDAGGNSARVTPYAPLALALALLCVACGEASSWDQDAASAPSEPAPRDRSAASEAPSRGAEAGAVARGQGGPGRRDRRGRGRPKLVTTVAVALQTVNDRMAAVGTARAAQRATLLTESAGVVDAVLFRAGQRVDAGAPLLRLDRRAEEIAILRARSALELAQATVDRLTRLGANATEVARQDARNALAVAEADLAEAEYEFDRKELRAPFTGVVGLTEIVPGAYVAVGATVATLDNRDALTLAFSLPERAMGLELLGKAIRANARAEPGRFYAGEIVAVDSRIDAATRTIPVEARLPNPEGRLLPGSTYAVVVRLRGERAPTVPSLALQWDRQGAHVWRVTAENTVERVDAVIVKREGDRIALRAALNAGDRIVHEGGDALSAGDRVVSPGQGRRRGMRRRPEGEERRRGAPDRAGGDRGPAGGRAP
ncbi:MAG: efflux RND transporter periplasmic adaptor subunit [Pseudomonadota bacterium]